jgi:DNA helicase II / ATP-dependent DNA helicase PcrA
MNSWRDSWTEKTVKGRRVLKEQGKLRKQQALADIYKSYQAILTERGLIDFSDMILQAIELVEYHDIVRMSLAEQYQFIMIDEFQDTNDAQMQLVNSITSVGIESPNIFAVGDDDQSIYKFQWANTKNIRHFHDTYPDTRLIILEKNYRSKSEIIEHSRAVIVSESNNIGNIFPWVTKQFEAVRENGGSVRKRRFHNELEEQAWIIEDIASKISNGTRPESIALITKKNKTLELYAKWLLEKGIEVTLSKDESIFEDESIILVIQILKLLDSMNGNYADEDKELLVTILSHTAFAINRLVLWNISKSIYHARKETNRSWIESLAHHEDKILRNTANFLKELSIRAHTDRLEDIIDSITGANSLSLPDDYDEDGRTNPLQIDMFAGERSDYISPLYIHFFDQISNHKWSNILYARHLANMRAFVEWVRKYKHGKPYLILHDAIEILGLIETYDLDISAPHIIGDERISVNLITVYKAKWLEWDHVYVPSLSRGEYKQGKIGWSPLPKNLPLEAERDNDEDIERLIYTAYTRAKDTLTITYADESLSERANEPLACIQIESGDWEEISSVPIADITKTLEVEKRSLFSLPYLGEENEFLRDRIEKIFVMNATALQNFLNVADAGPEYFVSNSLLRFPQAKNIAASYGSAIHRALEDFFSDYSKKW